MTYMNLEEASNIIKNPISALTYKDKLYCECGHIILGKKRKCPKCQKKLNIISFDKKEWIYFQVIDEDATIEFQLKKLNIVENEYYHLKDFQFSSEIIASIVADKKTGEIIKHSDYMFLPNKKKDIYLNGVIEHFSKLDKNFEKSVEKGASYAMSAMSSIIYMFYNFNGYINTPYLSKKISFLRYLKGLYPKHISKENMSDYYLPEYTELMLDSLKSEYYQDYFFRSLITKGNRKNLTERYKELLNLNKDEQKKIIQISHLTRYQFYLLYLMEFKDLYRLAQTTNNLTANKEIFNYYKEVHNYDLMNNPKDWEKVETLDKDKFQVLKNRYMFKHQYKLSEAQIDDFYKKLNSNPLKALDDFASFKNN